MHLRRPLAAVLSVGALLLATACGSSDSSDDDAADPTSSAPTTSDSSAPAGSGDLTIASQNFTEASIVASMYQQLLENSGYTVDVKLVDSRDAYLGIFPKDVDVVPEYVGGIVNALNARANGDKAKPFEAGDGAQLAADGKQLLDDAGITLLDVSEATDTNAFFVSQDYADQNSLTNLSDLEGTSVKLAAAPDCEGRLDCEGGLKDQYGIDITQVLPLGYATDQTYQAVIDGEAELGETSTTDATLEDQGLVLLADDKEIQPAQNLVPAVSTEFLTAHPDVADTLNALMAALTTENLTELNGAVSVDREDPADAAKKFLEDNDLL